MKETSSAENLFNSMKHFLLSSEYKYQILTTAYECVLLLNSRIRE
jgi:hypothetical protein